VTGHTVAADLLLETARALYRERRLRARHFPGSLFAEPTWDMLLDLYIADGERRQITVKSVCIAANVPTTTALRHLRWLQEGLVERLSHPRDARSTHVRLTAIAIVAMAGYLDEI
jgi:DNA-binding MarR family transcriptional regulator